MNSLWTNIISPVFHALGDVWQWLTSGSTPAVTVGALLLAVVVVVVLKRR